MCQAFLAPPSAPPRRARSHESCAPRMRHPSDPLLPAAAAAVILSTTLQPISPLLAQPATPPPPSAPTTTLNPSPVSDPARVLTRGQAARLSERLLNLEAATGLRVLIATRGPGMTRLPTASARTVVIALDPRAGNVLSFSVGSDVSRTLPPSFFVEATNRFGNSFYIRDNGLDAAVLAVVRAVEDCASSGRVCRYVPGVSDDQWVVSVACAASAGAVAGAAARTGGKRFNASFVLLFSPLWSIFLVSFGVGPIVARGPGVELQLASTIAAFAALAFAVWWWIPISFGPPGEDGSASL